MDLSAEIAVSRTYSITAEHIRKVIIMSQSTGKPQGEIVREAIDLLWDTLENSPTLTTNENDQRPTAA